MNDTEFLNLNKNQQKYLLKGRTSAVLILKNQLLRQACYCGHLETVKLLIGEGADINKKNYASQTSFFHTPLTEAIIGGHLEVLVYLKEQGARVDRREDFYLAVSIGKNDIIQYLTEINEKFWHELIDVHYNYPISQNVLNWIEYQKVNLVRKQIDDNLNLFNLNPNININKNTIDRKKTINKI